MAIWQWDVWIVPRQEIIKHLSVIPQYMDLDWFESINWWSAVSKSELVSFFNSILPHYSTTWATHTQSWGSDNGDRIELEVENDKVIDVVIRVDLRHLNINLLNSLVTFSEKNNFLFFSLEFKKFSEPILQELLKEIKNSRKMVFLKEPEKFFNDNKYLDKINKENRRKLE